MKLAILLIVVLLGGSSLLAQGASRAEGAKPAKETPAVSEGGNEFAFELYAKLAAGEKGNLFFSPSSVHTALAMPYVGAGGTTAQQMAKTLHYALPADKLAPAFGELLQILNTPRLTYDKKPAYELVVSNALWPQKGYPFKAAYMELVKKDFGATLEEVDYVKAPDAARKTVNDAVAKQTKDKIQDLVPRSAITPYTRLILTNAIYFKSNWKDKFRKEATKDEPFHLSGGKTADVPMMHRQGHYGYFAEDDLQVLVMPYMQRDLSMFVLLPTKADGLGDLEKKLSAAQVAKWVAVASETTALVQVSFPRFKFAGAFSMGKTLADMGMPDAMSLKANFTGMTESKEPFFISDVIHKSFVAVDEEGTEAAAATAVMMAGGAMPRPEQPKVFKADHPFVFLIRHNGTGAILFAGRLAAPEGGAAPKAAPAGAVAPSK